MKFAQIISGKVHWIFEADEKPDFSSDIMIVDITFATPKPDIGWSYVKKKFVAPEIITPALTEEMVRHQRDVALKNTDWTQISDAPISNEYRLAMAQYRQALRDITKQEGFPLDVKWPVRPE